MTGNEYQILASRTMLSEPDHEISPDQIMLAWNALGLAGEAGEVADEVKKFVFHQKDFDRAKLIKELGDVAWYMAAICTNLGVELEEVYLANIAKLAYRYPDGYSADAANRRHLGMVHLLEIVEKNKDQFMAVFKSNKQEDLSSDAETKSTN